MPFGTLTQTLPRHFVFTNKLDFFPNTFRPQELDKNNNGVVDPGRIFIPSSADGSINYSKPDGILSGPDQDRGALEGAIWAIVSLFDSSTRFDCWT